MKKSISICLAALSFALIIGLLVNSCAKIAPAFTVKSSAKSLSALYLTFADGTGGFSPDTSASNDSAIIIRIPWYYPDGSYTQTSLDSLIITGSIPNSSYMSPAFGLTNFTTPKKYTLTAQNGTKETFTITVVRTHSSKAAITSFKLNEANINGVIVGDTVTIPYAGTTLTGQTATVELSNYATISPDPTISRDYSNPVQYTVTADDGTKVVYTVKLGMPVKVAKGISKVTMLWSKSAGDLSFTDYRQISIAVSGGYFLLPVSNEWVSGSQVQYYSCKTGGYAGSLNVTGVERLYAIANDSMGKVVGINSLYAGNNVCLYEWDNVTAAPKLLAKTTDWSSVGGAFYGRKISVYGNLSGDAVIMATTDGTGGGGVNNILKWTVKGGAIVSQDPEVITYPVAYDYVAKAVPTGPESSSDFFFCSNSPSFMTYVNGTSHAVEYSFSSNFVASPRGNTPALTWFTFNNASFAAVVDASAYSSALHIFDVTDPSVIGTSATSANYSSFHVFDGSSSYVSCPDPNYNVTAEIAVGPVSADGYTMPVYFLVTNGGVVAYELSCVQQ
ncbi:MAG: DUF5018 domain-containing protein [Puia sp.]|nr:DUF5018 domain-containing protein [Puia sp.]